MMPDGARIALLTNVRFADCAAKPINATNVCWSVVMIRSEDDGLTWQYLSTVHSPLNFLLILCLILLVASLLHRVLN